MKSSRVPRTRAGGMWTEARYWSFIRSALRKASTRYPPIVKQALELARRPYTGNNPRQKYEYQCAWCLQWFKRTEVQVDHIRPCGSLRKYSDLPRFVRTLLCEVNNLRVLCRECHGTRDHGENEIGD